VNLREGFYQLYICIHIRQLNAESMMGSSVD
jgi:hypothetical protein